MAACLYLAMYLIANVIISISIMAKDMVLAELKNDTFWNMAGLHIQRDNCSFTNADVMGQGLVLTGRLSHPCRIHLSKSPSTAVAVLIDSSNSSSEMRNILIIENQDYVLNCDSKYVLIGVTERCVSLFQYSNFQLSLYGDFTVHISLNETNQSDKTGCPYVTEVNNGLKGNVSHLNTCQITHFNLQISCNISRTSVCNLDLPSQCKATLGYGNIELYCSENYKATHKALFIYPDTTLKINLTKQRIVEIHGRHFQALISLEVLILDENYLNVLHPNVFTGLISLKYLSIKSNSLQNLHVTQFADLKQLTFLSLTYNNLANLGRELFHSLTNLRELHLSGNSLQTFHKDQFRYLKNLNVLKFSGNSLTNLPKDIFTDLGNLTALFFGRNQIMSLNSKLFNSTRKLLYLSGGDNNLTRIPREIFQDLEDLEIIKLYRCRIKAIPNGVFKGLTKAKAILFYGNQIESLNSNLFNDTKDLKDLSFGDNKLTALPYELLIGLTSLKKLKFYRNQIRSLPRDFFNETTDLELISFVDNNLTTLPRNIFGSLNKLKHLLLDRNEISSLNDDLFSVTTKLERLQLLGNRFLTLPENIFQRLVNLKDLRLFHNKITSLDSLLFKNLKSLKSLFLFVNNITRLPHNIFMNLHNLEILRLENNRLIKLDSKIFSGLRNLITLFLSNNSLHFLNINIFKDLQNIKLLDLSGNKLQTIPDLTNLRQMQYLNIHDNPLTSVTRVTFEGLSQNINIIVSQEEVCTCYVSDGNNCTAINVRSPYQTCDRLLSDHTVLVLMWFIGVSAIVGNIFVLGWNKVKSERDKVQSFLLSNLAMSDLLMGIYMIIIAFADICFGNNFPMTAEGWRSGVSCRITGTLSIVSCEASVFFVTLISLDRFIHIRYPFTQLKLRRRSMIQVAALVWTLSLALGIVPSSLAGKADIFYDNSHVCVGLPLTKITKYSKSVHYEKTYPFPSSQLYFLKPVAESAELGSFSGMYFSVAMFLGLNGICYITVLFCYVDIVRCVIKSSKRVGLQQEKKEQIEMTMKVAAIVLTDFLCWFPIIIMGILVQTDVLILPPSVFAWCVTVVLPINSAINPYLYTISTIISNRCREARASQHSQNISMQQRKTSTTRDSHIESTLAQSRV